MKKTIMDIIDAKLQKGGNVLLMAVGDSITWGMNHCTAEETYCAELARLLGKHFPEATVLRCDGIMDSGGMPLKEYAEPVTVQSGGRQTLTVVRCGVGGDTVRRALNRADNFTGRFLTGELPDVFLLMFGINDALRNDPLKYVTPEVYYQDLKELHTLLSRTNPNAQLVFLTPTYNDSGEYPQSHLLPYCIKMKELAEEVKAPVIDTHRLWQEHLIVGSAHYGQREWLSGVSGDSCHFSPAGSIATARFIYEAMKDEEITERE